MKRNSRQKSLSFDQPVTDENVLDAFANTTEWLTRKMVAERVDRVKSPTFTARLESLADRGCLEKNFHRLPNGVDMVIYRRREECERGFQTHSED